MGSCTGSLAAGQQHTLRKSFCGRALLNASCSSPHARLATPPLTVMRRCAACNVRGQQEGQHMFAANVQIYMLQTLHMQVSPETTPLLQHTRQVCMRCNAASHSRFTRLLSCRDSSASRRDSTPRGGSGNFSNQPTVREHVSNQSQPACLAYSFHSILTDMTLIVANHNCCQVDRQP
jgi:hypothetical protein